MRSTRWLRMLVPLLILAALVGCGGEDGDGDAAKEGRTITAKVFEEPQPGIPADVGQWMADVGVVPGDDLAFTVAKVISPSGNANFRLKNPQAVGHDLTIEEVGTGTGSVQAPLVREGSSWVRISLFAGERYVFYCSVPGHREAGMEGTIEVDPRLNRSKNLKPF
jgi:plastocyanin